MSFASRIKAIIKREAYKQGVLLQPLGGHNEVRNFLHRFREKYVPIDLVRVGGDGDGGYLVPSLLEDIRYCFSPGVDCTANFEAELSRKFGIKSFMADASVEKPPLTDENFIFSSKFLGSRSDDKFITLSDWITQCVGDDTGERILQMDIEGGEYDVLTFESADVLAQFSSMIIEFHNMESLFEKNFFNMYSSIFEKIYLNFSICHVHPNNNDYIVNVDGIEIPRVIEVTFIRNDLVDQLAVSEQISLPHRLDRQNRSRKKSIEMPEIWWSSSFNSSD